MINASCHTMPAKSNHHVRHFSFASCLVVVFMATRSSAALTSLPQPSANFEHGLDPNRFELDLVYEADFSAPLKMATEAELFENGRRARKPDADIDWVLEGRATARTEKTKLKLLNQGDHLVFWNTRRFPADFLLEFEVMPRDPNAGLNIVFFSASARDGGSIFDLDQEMRDAVYKKYHSGGLDAYHVSYWATRGENNPQGAAHLRKSHGFHLVATGDDLITGRDRKPHVVRVLKVGGTIAVEVSGGIAIHWKDEGHEHGPVLRDGFIGLRQMVHTGECDYSSFKVWRVTGAPERICCP